MARLPTLISVPLGAVIVTLAASAVGLAVNAVRPGGIALVAPFPYEQDCPDKVVVPAGPTVDPGRAVRLAGAADVLFIDARPLEVYTAGHIPGARSLPFSFVTPVAPADAAELKKTRHLIVYCDSPGDKLAGLLAQQLREAGVSGVKVLTGGWAAFQNARPGGLTR